MLHNLALRRQVPFLQEDEAGEGCVAAVEPVDSDEDEAERYVPPVVYHGLPMVRHGDSWVIICGRISVGVTMWGFSYRQFITDL
ncbi:hypothetical protein NDU88_007121 [Pleurodeles waltl]|uniref:Uncharacterized protein n=1 Tax=Pleurodeles waltl TaxID=8319 RepID=A0AAV7VTE7_PLEWA|nr:hypothetical protein NDU88_007121 [Pleurodeles waltl]